MGKITYEVVEHDGGWAYRADGVYSETYRSRQDAHDAAEAAAREQHAPGEDEEIEWEDARGKWHGEHSDGHDRPDAEVKD